MAGFWQSIETVLREVAVARTADELIAVVSRGPDQESRDSAAAAFFAGSGGDEQLIEVLDPHLWTIQVIEGDYHWKATSHTDGSVIEYIEGDIYRR